MTEPLIEQDGKNETTDNIADDIGDDYMEPVGSCENCGTNLYEDDDDELCDQCLWRSQFGA